MRNRFKLRVLVFFLTLFAVCLLPFALAAQPKVLGQIVRSQGTSLDGTAVPNEGSVVAGDRIETNGAGSALLRFAADAEAVLGASTRVTFSDETGKLTASLATGGMTIEAPGTATVVTLTPNCEVEPSAQTAVTYFISFSAQQGTTVQARTGTVRVTALPSGSARMVPAGEQVLVAQNTTNGQAAGEKQEAGKASPSVPAGPAQPGTATTPATASSAPGTPQESGRPSPSEPAGPSMPSHSPAPHHSSTAIIVVVAGVAGAAGAALAASGGGHGPASPSGP